MVSKTLASVLSQEPMIQSQVSSAVLAIDELAQIKEKLEDKCTLAFIVNTHPDPFSEE